MSQRGRFITLEGGEGVGKSTNLQFVVDWLRAQGRDVILFSIFPRCKHVSE